MTVLRISASILVALIALTAAAAWLNADQKAPVERPPTDFSKKFLFVEMKDGFNMPLLNARFKQAAGQGFLVGEPVNNNYEEAGIYGGSTLWLPALEVSRMCEVSDLDELRIAIQKFSGRHVGFLKWNRSHSKR